VTVEQVVAARALLHWRQEILAERASVGISTLRRVEGQKSGPIKGVANESKIKIIAALQGAGIRFLPGGGVDLIASPKP
jgi:hypothetical protein